MRSAFALLAGLAAVVFLFGSSGRSGVSGGGTETTAARVLTGYDLSIALPPAWDGRIYENDTGLRVVQSANIRLEERDDDDVASASIEEMGSDGIIVVVWYWPDLPPPGQRSAPESATLPIQIGRSDFGDFSCFGDPPAPGTAMRIETVDSGLVQTVIFFGSENPSDDAIAQANSVLASLGLQE